MLTDGNTKVLVAQEIVKRLNDDDLIEVLYVPDLGTATLEVYNRSHEELTLGKELVAESPMVGYSLDLLI